MLDRLALAISAAACVLFLAGTASADAIPQTGIVQSVSPDGRYLVFQNGDRFVAADEVDIRPMRPAMEVTVYYFVIDGRKVIWSYELGRPVGAGSVAYRSAIPETGIVQSVSPDGRRFVLQNGDWYVVGDGVGDLPVRPLQPVTLYYTVTNGERVVRGYDYGTSVPGTFVPGNRIEERGIVRSISLDRSGMLLQNGDRFVAGNGVDLSLVRPGEEVVVYYDLVNGRKVIWNYAIAYTRPVEFVPVGAFAESGIVQSVSPDGRRLLLTNGDWFVAGDGVDIWPMQLGMPVTVRYNMVNGTKIIRDYDATAAGLARSVAHVGPSPETGIVSAVSRDGRQVLLTNGDWFTAGEGVDIKPLRPSMEVTIDYAVEGGQRVIRDYEILAADAKPSTGGPLESGTVWSVSADGDQLLFENGHRFVAGDGVDLRPLRPSMRVRVYYVESYGDKIIQKYTVL